MQLPASRSFRALCLVVGLLVAGLQTISAQTGDEAKPITLPTPAPDQPASLSEARRGFATRLIIKEHLDEPAPEPPADTVDPVKYHSPAGDLSAYVTRPPATGKKFPAVIWLPKGFTNSIGKDAWAPSTVDDDQSAAAFRETGIVTMYPSLRGGNDNPGFIENFYGEVDDVLAAREWLARLPFVDPARIYLGGYGTGGTLALLVAEYPGAFRGIFAFSPVPGPRGYEMWRMYYDQSSEKETELRAPFRWLNGITSPTFVFDGEDAPSNVVSLNAMAKINRNPAVHFLPVTGVNQFGVVLPVTRLIAQKILHEDSTGGISISAEEVAAGVTAGAAAKK